jgi:general secretion pathway protein C
MRLQNTLALLVCLSAHAESAPDNDAVIVPPADCQHAGSDKTWTLKREARLAEILKALSELTCERFFVSRALLDEKLTIDVGAEAMSSWELHQRVEGALRARGIVLDLAQASRVRRSADVRSVPPSASPTSNAAVSVERLDKAIKCQANRCTLTREIADAMLADSTGFATSARVVPSFKDGKPVGFKLFAIRPGSYFGHLGRQNGDLVLALDGHELRGPDNVLEAYAALRGKSDLKLALERRGEKLTIEYVIK